MSSPFFTMTSLGWNALRHTQSYTYIFVLFPALFRQCAHQYERPKNWNSLKLIWKQIRNHFFSQPLLLLRFFKWNIKQQRQEKALYLLMYRIIICKLYNTWIKDWILSIHIYFWSLASYTMKILCSCKVKFKLQI